MRMKIFRLHNVIALAGLTCLVSTVSLSHVTIWPRESTAGATEKCTAPRAHRR